MFTSVQPTGNPRQTWVVGKTHVAAQADTDVSITHNEVRKLTEALVCRVDSLALDAVTVMSGVNRLQATHRTVTAADLQKFLPTHEDQLPMMVLALSELSYNFTRELDVTSFVDAILMGRDAVNAFIADVDDIGADHARIVNAARLKLTWQRVCRHAIVLVQDTTIQLRGDLPLAYRQNSAVLVSLLSGAVNGLSPCFDDDGRLSTPSLPQQRRWPRYTILQNGTLHWDGQTFEIFVVDASAGGLGLANTPELPRNCEVNVTIENGRTLNCIVAWSNGERTGVRFPAPLAQADPLLTG